MLSLFLVACQSAPGSYDFGDLEVFEYDIDGETFYFSYPATSYVKDFEYLTFNSCKVYFGEDRPEPKEGIDVNKKKNYEAWFNEKLFITYLADVDGFYFYVQDSEDVSACTELLEMLASSFTDELIYENDKYDFRMVIPTEYKVDYLDEDAGLVFSKWVDIEIDPDDYEDGEIPETKYKVEMVILPFENMEGFNHISEYIAEKYAGYSLQFVEYDKVSGFYIDEGLGDDAIRHFFTLNRKGDAVIEAYLQLKSAYYNDHKESFDSLVSTIEIF